MSICKIATLRKSQYCEKLSAAGVKVHISVGGEYENSMKGNWKPRLLLNLVKSFGFTKFPEWASIIDHLRPISASTLHPRFEEMSFTELFTEGQPFLWVKPVKSYK